jgi:hypothetical protein
MCSYQGSTQEIQIPLSMFLLCPVVVQTFLVLVSNLEKFHLIRMVRIYVQGPSEFEKTELCSTYHFHMSNLLRASFFSWTMPARHVLIPRDS